jgi:hypothetical protein
MLVQTGGVCEGVHIRGSFLNWRRFKVRNPASIAVQRERSEIWNMSPKRLRKIHLWISHPSAGQVLAKRPNSHPPHFLAPYFLLCFIESLADAIVRWWCRVRARVD